MKRLTFTLIWMATMAIPAIADGTLTFNSIECEKEQPGANSHMTVEFPTGDDSPLRRAIIDYIYQNLRTMGNLTIHLEEGPLAPADKHVHFPSNTCDETVFKTFLEEVTTIVMDNRFMLSRFLQKVTTMRFSSHHRSQGLEKCPLL